MSSRPAALVGALLVGFHGWLLAVHAWTGELADPGLALRWVTAAGLLAGLVALRRQGLSRLSRRRAVAIWVLAAVLHAPALADRLEHASPALPEAVATMAGAASVSLAVLSGLALAGARGRRRGGPRRGPRAAAATPGPWPACPALLHRLSPRPPPALALIRS